MKCSLLPRGLSRAWWVLIASFTLLFVSGLNAQTFLQIALSGPGPALPNQIAPGGTATFETTDLPPPTGQLQWLHNNQPVAGANASTLTLTNATSADTGNYQLVVTGSNPFVASNTLTLNVLPLPADPVDTSFVSGLTDTANVWYTAPLAYASDGSMVLAGKDYNNGNLLKVVRMLSNGSLDGTFNYPLSAGNVLAGFPNGALIVANSPYRLNADGSANAFTLPAGFDSTKPLTAAAVQADGKILIAQGMALARLNSDGSVDTSFTYTSALSTSVSIDSLQIDAAGRIYVHGWNQQTSPLSGIAYRLLATGSEDTGFSHQTGPYSQGLVTLFLLNNGSVVRSIYYGGSTTFTLLNNDGSVNSAYTQAGSSSISSPTVDPVNGLLFYTNSANVIQCWNITASGLVFNSSFYAGDTWSNDLQAVPTGGKLLVMLGKGAQWDGYASPGLVRLLDTTTAPALPATVSIGSSPSQAQAGQSLTFTSNIASGTGPFTYQWFALDGQPLPASTTSSTLVIPSYGNANAGRYQVQVTGAAGAVLSPVLQTKTTDSSSVYLSNLSGRAMSGTGEDTIIAGLTVNMSSGTQLAALLRGAGPALQPLGVSDYLPNPVLNLYNVNGQIIGNNDNWGNDPALQNAFTLTGAFPFAANSNDSALLRNFSGGNYTLMLTDQSGGSGVGLVEIYRTDSNQNQTLTNLSLRADTGPGDATAIVGFVLVDPQNLGRARQVLLRAVGPTLSQYGIAHPLADPVLTLYDSKGNVIASNDNWGDGGNGPALTAAMSQVGAFALPAGSLDSGLLVDLPAGVYTIHATGGSGVVLLEIYVMP